MLGAVNVGRAHGRQQLYLHVSNAGNVARRPQGAVSIQTRSGATCSAPGSSVAATADYGERDTRARVGTAGGEVSYVHRCRRAAWR